MRAKPSHEILQWFALLGAPLVWAAQHVVGVGITFAACSSSMQEMRPHEVGTNFGIGGTTWELALTVAAATVAVLGEVAAVWLFLALRDHDNEPPGGRHIFFAYAAVPSNLIFIGLILASGTMSLYKFPCVQA